MRIKTLTNQNGVEIPYEMIRAAMKGEHYPMNLVGAAAVHVRTAVNQGIDAHLEACYCKERGDSYEVQVNRLICSVSPESLPVLLRRLFEMDPGEDEDGGDGPDSLASDILQTLGFNEFGQYREREE